MINQQTDKIDEIDSDAFEDKSVVINETQYWRLSDLSECLGMNFSVLKRAMDLDETDRLRQSIAWAQELCEAMDITVSEHFYITSRPEKNTQAQEDLFLSRFACFLLVIFAAPFSNSAEQTALYLLEQTRWGIDLDIARYEAARILYREKVTEREKLLTTLISQRNVKDYSQLRNAGYLGLYKMRAADFRKKRRLLGDETVSDFMGKEELAVNRYRLDQTLAFFERDQIFNQEHLEKLAYSAGRDTRKSLKQLTGNFPEDYPVESNINQVKARYRKIARHFDKASPTQINSIA
jgi:DNA-damage-inducible protein D